MNNDFKAYLQAQGFAGRTIEEDIRNVQRFMQWMEVENYPEASALRYNDILGYIQKEKATQVEAVTINLRLSSISKYFEFLKSTGVMEKNLLRTLRVKGEIKKVIHNPLSFAELEQLYHQYAGLKPSVGRKGIQRHHRNTVILGLLVYQGLHGGELKQLKTEHILLQRGKIYIPSTGRSNSRELTLSALQILSIHEYLERVREDLLPVNDLLIPGNMHNLISLLIQICQGLQPALKNALHIRGSVILYWLKEYNKRQVQYMAGHRYISSTEQYAQQDMSSLSDELSKHHPFG